MCKINTLEYPTEIFTVNLQKSQAERATRISPRKGICLAERGRFIRGIQRELLQKRSMHFEGIAFALCNAYVTIFPGHLQTKHCFDAQSQRIKAEKMLVFCS